MPFGPGTRLGPYEITALLGEGGMGKVWRAHHTALKRDDALKVLPDAFASDPDRLARFQREAQVLASLNHPNIAHVYGLEQADGVHALVMELVEGEDLSQRIARGPIPLDEALPIARQICEALEAAHEQSIIHRDLKPANIKVREDGTVKVLDFGLAKLAESAGAPTTGPSPLSMSPTITSPAMMTGVGVLLGTAAYMSPEQARGKPADKRSDIWAFGCVLYEMLTGKRAFECDDVTDTLAAVLRGEPDWTVLPTHVPQAVRTLVERCLAKDRVRRVSDIAAAKFVLSELSSLSVPPVAATAPGSENTWRGALVPVLVTVVLTALIIGAGTWALKPTIRPPVVAQFSFSLPEGQAFTGTTRQVVAISPDGGRIAYVANARLYLRSLTELEPQPIPGTDMGALNLVSPVFAPDGESIAFWNLGSGVPGRGLPAGSATLMRVPVAGGTPLSIANTEIPFGASWGPNGILIGQGAGGILRIPPNGGVPERIVNVARDELAYGPQMLPDGRTVLFTLAKEGGDERWDKARIVAYSLTDGSRKVLIDGGSDGRYLSSGHLVYAVAGTLFAVPFDAKTLLVTAAAAPVISGVRRVVGASTGAAQVSISESGTLAYLTGPAAATVTSGSVVLGDGRGEPVPLHVPPGQYTQPRVSPDGKVLAVGRNEGAQSDIWTYDLSGRTEIRRLTFGGNNRFPVWSSDARRVTFQSTRDGDPAIYWQAEDGTGAAERLTKAAEGEAHVPESWSPDGTHLLFSVVKGTTYALWVLRLSDRKTERFGTVQSIQPLGAVFSPDGRWVAYAFSDQPGGLSSPNRGVFLEPFPPTGEKHQVPKTSADFHPLWSRDGKAILYIPTSAAITVSVPVVTRPSVAFGKPVELPRVPRPGQLSVGFRGYDILPDGRIVSLAPVSEVGQSTVEVRVVLNWTEELKRLVPTK